VCVERQRGRDTPAQATAHDDEQRAELGAWLTADLVGCELAQMLAYTLRGDHGHQLIEVPQVVWDQDK
jgi:hypothetical protein